MTQEGWGSGRWGSSQWGFGNEPPPPIPPTITPVEPLPNQSGIPQSKPICFVLSDDLGISIGTLQVSVGGDVWVVGGVAVNGIVMTATLNDQHGYDVELVPSALYPVGSRQEVSIYIRDVQQEETSLVFFFNVGVGPRVLLVRNPRPNILLVHFNKPMLIDDKFKFIPNWRITPISEGAAPLTITEVSSTSTQPDVAHIKYTGGGSVYELTALGSILSQEGDPLEGGFNTVVFDIIFGEEDPGTIRLFDSVFGPLGISQRVAKRRSFDEHTADRSLALALDEQFRLRFQQLDNTAGRDGKPGKLRT
jgi:hypothetical protein